MDNIPRIWDIVLVALFIVAFVVSCVQLADRERWEQAARVSGFRVYLVMSAFGWAVLSIRFLQALFTHGQSLAPYISKVGFTLLVTGHILFLVRQLSVKRLLVHYSRNDHDRF